MHKKNQKTGLLTHYFSEDYDLKNSFVIGDRLTDVELAKNLGSKIFINDNTNLEQMRSNQKSNELQALLETNDWEAIYNLKTRNQNSSLERNTKRNHKIAITVNLMELVKKHTNWIGLLIIIIRPNCLSWSNGFRYSSQWRFEVG
jgi:imidazoleglycerol-phosphate dehydratase/histidinol-phosphatase